ncbi:MAG: class I SAM-dependent methyltransferase [Bradyrhizobium sp.]|nr:class I SAM-dependent methyltransferase [Bradyrhizobium sp.]
MKLPRIVRQFGKSAIKSIPILRRQILISSDYKLLSGAEEARSAAASSAGWLAARTVARQERAYRRLIDDMRNGEPRLDLAVAAEAVVATGITAPRLLEVGCGSGYYSEVFAGLVPGGIGYTGIDYSEAMIARARANYPLAAFEVADATRLPFPDGTFDIVFNGVSLMHIIDYQAAIREAARVAGRYCILHTVPVFDHHRTTYLSKYAYGAPVVEIVFDRSELLSLCAAAGLHLQREWPCIPYDVSELTGHRSTTVTWLFAKDADR